MAVRDWVIRDRAVRSHSIAILLRLVRQQLYAYSIILSLRHGAAVPCGPWRALASPLPIFPTVQVTRPHVCALHGVSVSTGPVDVHLAEMANKRECEDLIGVLVLVNLVACLT